VAGSVEGRKPASGGGSRARDPAWSLGEIKVRERLFGANEGWRAETPAGVGRGRGGGGRIWPSPALPSWEARIKLLNRAGLRGIILVNWAVPTSARPVYQTAKLSRMLVGQVIARLGRPTKHTLYQATFNGPSNQSEHRGASKRP
jgi:hypothetical protein